MSKLPNIKIDPAYTTAAGAAYCGNSLDLLQSLPESSVNLVMTSPPFALLRKKSYGNETQVEYVDWLLRFCKQVRRVLTEDGSLAASYAQEALLRFAH